MKDPIKFIKDTYLNLLTGAVTYNGSTIPVYDEEAEESGSDYYIIVGTVTDADIPNKDKFHNELTVLIDVVTQSNFRLSKSKEIVDVITGKVLNLVLPTPASSGITGDSDFQVLNVRKESSQHLPILDTGTKKIVRRVTRFSQYVVES